MSGAQTEPEQALPVVLEVYEDDADLEIDNSGEYPTVENHDDLVKRGLTYQEVRGVNPDSVEEWDHDVVEPGDPLWSDKLEEIQPGETFRPEELRGQATEG